MIIAVDTGEARTLVASFAKGGKTQEQYHFKTPKSTTEYIDILAKLIEKNFKLSEVTAICVAVPGVVKNDQAILCPNLGWKNFFLPKVLKERLSLRNTPIYLENDANLGGLAETQILSKKGETSLYITIGAGIGTSITRQGKIDPSFRLSEGGHMLLEFDGMLRDWESFASGRAIYETYGRHAKDITSERVWQDIADKISRGLAVIIPLLHPEIIIFGGSVGTYFSRYKTTLNEILNERLPLYIDRPLLVQALHPEEAVINGCHLYALQQLTH